MNSYHEQVKTVIRVIMFHSPTTYTWFGKLSPRLPSAIKQAITPQTARNYLLYSLQSQLYNSFYCKGFAAPAEEKGVDLPTVEVIPFIRELSTANSGEGCWEGGWQVRTIEGDQIVVRRDGLELWVGREHCLTPQDDPIRPDMQLSLCFGKELLGISPGFYMALSNKELLTDNAQTLVRFYWNFTPQGAIRVMRNITSLLNKADLPFTLKAVNDPTRFTRCDVVVLYIRQSDYNAVSGLLGETYPEVANNLRQGTPALTKPLAMGLGLAEDPGQGNSFGLHRCRLLADGLIRAYEQGKKSLHQRLQVVEDRFAEEGISLETPFLNPGSRDDYDFQPQPNRPSHLSHHKAVELHTEADAGVFLCTAQEIGQRLSREAVWHLNLCNWL